MATERFQKAKRAGQGDANRCSVIAASIACRIPYNRADKALLAAGRKRNDGVHNSQLLQAIRDLGCDAIPVTNRGDKPLRQPNGSKYTPKTIGQRLKHGYYICRTYDHFFAVVNGEVEDWADGHNHRINKVWRITVPRGSRS